MTMKRNRLGRRSLWQKLWPYALNLVLIIGLYFLLQGLMEAEVIDRYNGQLIRLIGLNIILAVSLNLACGYLGQLALGHAGFLAVGAYAGAVLTKSVEALQVLPDWLRLTLAMLLGGLLAAVFGILIGIPALRLKGDYLAILTLGFGEIIRVIINNLEITNAGRSLSAEKITTFPIVYWVTILTIAIVYTFVYSRHGRAVVSIREDEVAAEASGVHITYYKVMAFTLAAALAGVCGALWSHTYVIRPEHFDFNKSIDILIFVVLGGMGSITGSVLAATALTVLPEVLRGFNEYRMVIYSLLLIVMMVFRPGGLLGKYEFSLSRVIRKTPAFCRRVAAFAKGKRPSKKEGA